MPSADKSPGISPSRSDEFEDIEILRNLLEIRTGLKKEKQGIDIELE